MSVFLVKKSYSQKIAAILITTIFTQLISGLLVPSYAQAAFNKQINYQGKLTNTSNVAVTDGSYNMSFKLYTTLTGGVAIWTEDDLVTNGQGVPVTNGLFSVMLGSTTALTGVDFNQTLYLGVTIGGTGGSPSWDTEMSPRKILGAVPAAMVADTLQGYNATQFIRSDAANSTSTSNTYLSIANTGAGKVAEFFGASSNSILSILSGGNVGIGTTTPVDRLAIHAASDLTGITLYNAVQSPTIKLLSGAANSGARDWALVTNAISYGDFAITNSSTRTGSPFANYRFYISQTGNVGIGSTTPATLLSVAGHTYLTGGLGVGTLNS